MSTLKLKGSTSGYVELTAPATAGDNTITLPTGSGTVVVGDGSGNITITGVTTVSAGSTSAPSITPSGDPNTGVFFPSADTIAFAEGGAEAARIDSSGRLLVGTNSARDNIYNNLSGVPTQFQIEGTGYTDSAMLIVRNSNDANDGGIVIGKTRGTTVGSNTVVQDDDSLGEISFQGADGSGLVSAVEIKAFVDGTPGANDMPGRLVFSTTADGASSPTQRMVIKQNGTLGVVVDSPSFSYSDDVGFEVNGSTGAGLFNVSNNVCLYVHRKTTDGNLVVFVQDAAQEGSISVSGTTVSYNGAHLSRWSQLPSGAERTKILRGTVLSNIDEMCEWGEEENEQLNRMKVSDVEGDKNVSGVFQAWDDDDDTYTNDFYCAMTGDFVIRIGSGVTVERGDLLMSAGDGTAKPQDDDIVRSKTVAKVTSTSVTCTYDDGSYCVPCVLMAC